MLLDDDDTLSGIPLPSGTEVAPSTRTWDCCGPEWQAGPTGPPSGPEDDSAIRQAAEVLRAGGLVAFPTETVYGLGADATNAVAVEAVFAAKGRPADNPLIVHIADPRQLDQVAETVPPYALRLARRFWPGPLTLVLPARRELRGTVTRGLDTVAVRVPDHPVALALLRRCGLPVAAPSANLSGRPSPTTARHVLNDLEGKVEVVLDGGPCRVGIESTVLDLSVTPPRLLRPGAITHRELEAVLGMAVVGEPLPEEPSPGASKPEQPGRGERQPGEPRSGGAPGALSSPQPAGPEPAGAAPSMSAPSTSGPSSAGRRARGDLRPPRSPGDSVGRPGGHAASSSPPTDGHEAHVRVEEPGPPAGGPGAPRSPTTTPAGHGGEGPAAALSSREAGSAGEALSGAPSSSSAASGAGSGEEPVRSPGLRYRHYTPSAPVVLVDRDVTAEDRLRLLRHLVEQRGSVGWVAAATTAAEVVPGFGPALRSAVRLVRRQDAGDLTRNLFADLRDLESAGAGAVVVDAVAEAEPVMDRVRRAAALRVRAGDLADGRLPTLPEDEEGS